MEVHAKQRKAQMDQDQRKLDAALEPMDTMKRCTIMKTVDAETSNCSAILLPSF